MRAGLTCLEPTGTVLPNRLNAEGRELISGAGSGVSGWAADFEAGRSEGWVQQAHADEPDRQQVRRFEESLGEFPIRLAEEQLRKMKGADDPGSKQDALAANSKAWNKAVDAHRKRTAVSDFKKPQLQVRGREVSGMRARVRAGTLQPRQLFRTQGGMGVNENFSLSEQRALLAEGWRWALTDVYPREGHQGSPPKRQRSKGSFGPVYVEQMRPKKAAGTVAPQWLVRLSRQVRSGEDFWE